MAASSFIAVNAIGARHSYQRMSGTYDLDCTCPPADRAVGTSLGG